LFFILNKQSGIKFYFEVDEVLIQKIGKLLAKVCNNLPKNRLVQKITLQ